MVDFVSKTTVFSPTSPPQKMQIVRCADCLVLPSSNCGSVPFSEAFNSIIDQPRSFATALARVVFQLPVGQQGVIHVYLEFFLMTIYPTIEQSYEVGSHYPPSETCWLDDIFPSSPRWPRLAHVVSYLGAS